MTVLTRRRAQAGFMLVCALGVSACSGSASSSGADPAADASYGGLPSFLPSAAIHPDSVLDGSAAKPALTTEGDAVRVRLSDASLLATLSGPEVPGEGLPYEPASTTCTWKVTLTAATAAVPIRASDFTATDHLGNVYRPVLVPGQPVPPGRLAPGRSVTFELRALMTTGEGLMRWAPQGRIVASWDFEVEDD